MATSEADGVEARLRNSWERGDFATIRAYMYWCVWTRFIIRESQEKGIAVPEDASDEDIKQLRINAGLCLVNVVLHPEARTAVFNPTARCAFKARTQLWLSRVDPEEDCFKHILEIQEVTNTSTLICMHRRVFFKLPHAT